MFSVDIAHENVAGDLTLRVEQARSDPAFALVPLHDLGQQAFEVMKNGELLYVYAIVEGYELIVENLLRPPASRTGVVQVAEAVAAKLA
jgi:hypothetical protein